ncbi:hypothetical protein EDL79_01220 [Ehrlichia ruminantium]|uniref:Uncharacterized protein n=1 Tax=Ehrlichia ruminantium TaxID=779 RepID=A0AAE6UJD6_EHRRU|nr:hypothetical protein [Ehrlichia ruminantium]QGR02301.1 hypothetical protein EDL81_01220 [Ehrlichia ruminantium]QGR03221.1 hypothetical protein EDL80_01220 [Ehrlichia ruminantium]QGR04146.1 hypothetical protein EDL79_01220 [Ehrlichia ruminantium]
MNKNLETILEEILETPFFHSIQTIGNMNNVFYKVNRRKVRKNYQNIIKQYEDFQIATTSHLDHAIFLLYMRID